MSVAAGWRTALLRAVRRGPRIATLGAVSRPTIDVHGVTHPGKVRPGNEDQFLIARLGKELEIRASSLVLEDRRRLRHGSLGHLLSVADGMGGHVAGQEASRIAVDATVRYVLDCTPSLFRLDGEAEERVLEELAAAVRESHHALERDIARHPERAGMGTTLTLAYVLWPRLYVVHAGDSRCYLLRTAGPLERITVDHTLAQRLLEEGQLTAEQARTSPYGNVLWNVVGGPEEGGPFAEVHSAPLQPGDVLLLCTDGLTRHVDDAVLERTLRQHDTAAAACDALLHDALEGGGEDNITVVVAHFGSTSPAAEPLAPICDASESGEG